MVCAIDFYIQPIVGEIHKQLILVVIAITETIKAVDGVPFSLGRYIII